MAMLQCEESTGWTLGVSGSKHFREVGGSPVASGALLVVVIVGLGWCFEREGRKALEGRRMAWDGVRKR